MCTHDIERAACDRCRADLETIPAPVVAAEVFLRGRSDPFVADRLERAGGLVTATGRFRYRRYPADRWGPRVTRAWPTRELRELRLAETTESA